MRTMEQLSHIAIGLNRELKKKVDDPAERRLILWLALGIEIGTYLTITEAAEIEEINNAG